MVKKAEFMLKLEAPNAYKAKKQNNVTSGLKKQLSFMLNSNIAKAKQSHIMIERQENQAKDSEFNWTDRLKAWKSVQNAKGAIVDLGSKGKLNSNSASMAILRILQSDHKVEDIQKTVENALIMSLRRSAGLNLLNFAMSFHGNEQIFFDML